MDPAVFDFFGHVELGFYRNKIDGKMQVVVKPIPTNVQDQTAIQITALYTAAVQASLEAVSKQVEQLGLVQKLKDLT
jgi:hypothetical protein